MCVLFFFLWEGEGKGNKSWNTTNVLYVVVVKFGVYYGKRERTRKKKEKGVSQKLD